MMTRSKGRECKTMLINIDDLVPIEYDILRTLFKPLSSSIPKWDYYIFSVQKQPPRFQRYTEAGAVFIFG